MNEGPFNELSAWLTQAGLAGTPETDIVSGFCDRCVAAGIPLGRAHVFIDTLHPVHEGRLFRWGYGPDEPPVHEYGRTSLEGLDASGPVGHFVQRAIHLAAATGGTHAVVDKSVGPSVSLDVQATDIWRRSPFYKMLQTGNSLLRRRLNADTVDEFSLLPDWLAVGMTDYVAIITRFAAEGVIGEMDAVYSSWATRAPDGFSDGQIAALERIVPYLALAIKSVSLARMTANADGNLSRPRRWPARAQRTDRARHCRTNRRRGLVQRLARIHAHHRHGAGTGHPIAERLFRCNRVRDP